MLPTYYDLEPAYREDDYGPVYLRVKSNDGYFDFTTCSEILLQARNKKNNAIVLEWSFLKGHISLLDDSFIMLHKKSGSRMKMLPGSYKYDLQATIQGSSANNTYMTGKILVVDDVSRS
jgi:hypothetical protein